MRDPYHGQTRFSLLSCFWLPTQPSQIRPLLLGAASVYHCHVSKLGPSIPRTSHCAHRQPLNLGLAKLEGQEGNVGNGEAGMDDPWGWSQEVVEAAKQTLGCHFSTAVLGDLSGEGMVDTHTCPGQTLWAQKNEPRFTEPALANLPDTRLQHGLHLQAEELGQQVDGLPLEPVQGLLAGLPAAAVGRVRGFGRPGGRWQHRWREHWRGGFFSPGACMGAEFP